MIMLLTFAFKFNLRRYIKYLEHGTNMASELETKMNAVERVVGWCRLTLSNPR
jgi:hypothetical protein